MNRLIDFYKIIKKGIIGNFRYVELNTRFSGGNKRYNETIPKYLQDKPRQFLKHCLERITTAKDIRPEFIKDGEKRGEFVIQSTQTKNTGNNLSFDGTDGMPRCSYPDFSRTGFLCKHFFALNTGMTGNGMLYPKAIEKTHISVLMTPSCLVLSRIMTSYVRKQMTLLTLINTVKKKTIQSRHQRSK